MSENFYDILEQLSEFSSPYQTTTPHGSLKRKKSYSTIDNLTLISIETALHMPIVIEGAPYDLYLCHPLYSNH